MLQNNDSQISKQMRRSRSPLCSTMEKYLGAKSQALQLTKDIPLFSIEQQPQYKSIVSDIVKEVSRCESKQKGQIYLILAQSALNFNLSIRNIPLPESYSEDVFCFVNALLSEKVSQKKPTSHIYKLRQKVSPDRVFFKEGKTKLKDLLLIERYDVVLSKIVSELQEREGQVRGKKIVDVSQECRQFFQDTVKIASKYLNKPQYEEYKENIAKIVGVKENNTPQIYKRTSASLFSLSQNYLIIDRTSQKNSTFHLRTGRSIKHPTIASNAHRQSKQSSSSHRSSYSRKSLLKDDLLKGISQGLRLKKNSMVSQSLHRGSGSSSCTLRSSVLMNHNFGTSKTPSNFGNSCKRAPRSSARFFARSSDLKVVGDHRPERKSRFQLLNQGQSQALRLQCNLERNSSQSQHSSELLINMKKGPLLYSYGDQRGQHSLSKGELRPFYIFLQLSGCVYLLAVEQQELEEGQLLQSGQIKSLFKVNLIQKELELYLGVELDIQRNQDEDIQSICQEYIVEHARLKKKNQNITIFLQNEETQRKGNCLTLEPPSQTVLMGFVRKISTYFIHTSKYQISQLNNCYHLGLRKKIVTENQPLSFPVLVTSRLMNSDLTMSFQEQQAQIINRGSVIHYIQNQDTSPEATFGTGDTYKLLFEYCAIKEWEDIKLWKIWASNKVREEPQQNKRRKGRKYNSKLMHKAITTDEQAGPRKLKRIPHNKSSIRIHSPDLEDIYQEYELRSTENSKMKILSKRDAILSQKKISKELSVRNKGKTKKERQLQKRTTSFVESIKTDQGYKLVKKDAIEQITGYEYNQYHGYKERNPQMTRFFKKEPQETQHPNYLQSRITVRGQPNPVNATKLITFVKPLRNTEDHFMGYLVSDIKILTLSANRCIFIETYWQKMQKHFIFTLSSQLFEDITDINTSHFWEKPFNKTEEKVSKKREKRTSVMNYFPRDKKERLENSVRGSSHKRNKNLEEDSNQTMLNARFKDNRTRFGQMSKFDKSTETFNSLSSKRTGHKILFKREILPLIKLKLVRCLTFLWKDHTLNLVLGPYPSSTQTYQFEGRQLAVKNIHQSPKDGSLASAIELILLKYKENNLTNLNIFTQQGLNQISLEHIFIKNNQDLFGRYENILHLSTLPGDTKVSKYYREHNFFFNKSLPRADKSSTLKSKNTSIMFSGREEQKRYKYAQILQFAKDCCLPFEFVEKKRKKEIKNSFIIPNRYPALSEESEMLRVHVQTQLVRVSNLLGGDILSFSIRKLENYLPYIRKLNQKQFQMIFQKRVLDDQDVMRLCQINEDDSI